MCLSVSISLLFSFHFPLVLELCIWFLWHLPILVDFWFI
jgi:hypothetical protein